MRQSGDVASSFLDGVGRVAFWATAISVVVVAFTAALVVFPDLRTVFGVGAPRAHGYAVGDRIDLPDTSFSGVDSTMAIFVRGSCAACGSAAPLFRRLVAETRDQGARILFVIGSSAVQRDREFIQQLGAEHVLELDFGRLRLKSVPTIVVVDREGIIRFVTSGVVAPEDLAAARRLLDPSPGP